MKRKKKFQSSKGMNKIPLYLEGGEFAGFTNSLPVGKRDIEMSGGGFFNSQGMNLPYSYPRLDDLSGLAAFYDKTLEYGGNALDDAYKYNNGGFFNANGMNMPRSIPQMINQSGAEQWYTPMHLSNGGYNHSYFPQPYMPYGGAMSYMHGGIPNIMPMMDKGGRPILDYEDMEPMMEYGGYPMMNHSLEHCEDGGEMNEMKSGGKHWIQKANASIKRRGTKGKCTPISKPGCTGRARALAKTFKKMARNRKHKKSEGGIIDRKFIGGEEYYLINE